MKLLKFNLHGKTAHFKKPDVNAYAYYTYSHIHKIALYGILGAILGLGGYNQQREEKYPEFYARLKEVRLGIVPIGKRRGYFSKKMITFNNSVGYANIGADKAPCNLVVREQWLEDVAWEIYIALDDLKDVELKEKLVEYILNSKAEYIPYLGKNDHIANISNPQLVECDTEEDVEQINSLFYYDEVELDDEAIDTNEVTYLFKDYMPTDLKKENNMYELKELAFTNRAVEDLNDQVIILDGEKYIALL